MFKNYEIKYYYELELKIHVIRIAMWTDWEATRGAAVKGKGYGKAVGEGTQ